jgi:hypothetical protein
VPSPAGTHQRSRLGILRLRFAAAYEKPHADHTLTEIIIAPIRPDRTIP